MGRLPTFIIIGAPRSGRTSLWHCLGQHPDVFVAQPKELHYLERPDADAAGYAAPFRGSEEAMAVGEASPTYLFRCDVIAPAIQRIVPDALLIALLREPVDRAYSHYWMSRARGSEDRSFLQAVREEVEGSARRMDPRLAYLGEGRYVRQLRAFEAVSGRDRLLVRLFDDLLTDPSSVFADVCRFVGVDASFQPSDLGRTVNPYIAIRSLRLRNLGKRLPKRLGNAVGRVNSRITSYAPVTTEERNEVEPLFYEDNLELEEWLGRRLPDNWVTSRRT